MIAIVHGRVREEEKLLWAAAQRLGIDVQMVSDDSLVLDLDGTLHAPAQPGPGGPTTRGAALTVAPDAVLVRSISTTRGLYVARAAEAAGVPVINSSATAGTCADKAATSWALRAAGVPTPETRVAFTPQAALDALDTLGYPAVLKPVQGSWARLVARVRDRAEAEQLLEHREQLPNPLQHVYYVQQYVDTTAGGAHPHRDIRAFTIGDECIGAIHRTSNHWITNTARGGTASGYAITDELASLCERASRAVGGGVLAMDLLEGPDGLMVHEVNHTMEFRNSISTTGVDIPGRVLEYVRDAAGLDPRRGSRTRRAVAAVSNIW